MKKKKKQDGKWEIIETVITDNYSRYDLFYGIQHVERFKTLAAAEKGLEQHKAKGVDEHIAKKDYYRRRYRGGDMTTNREARDSGDRTLAD